MISKCASLCLDAGMASFLNDEMRVYSPAVYLGNKKRKPFLRKYEYYWIVRAVTNSLLQLAKSSDFVLGVAVVGVSVCVTVDGAPVCTATCSLKSGVAYSHYIPVSRVLVTLLCPLG